MPYKKKYSKKGKWRQQKLAIGTVQKIARQIAKSEDKKNIKYYINNVFHAADSFNWDSVTEICPSESYRPIINGALESQIMSDVSGLLFDNIPNYSNVGPFPDTTFQQSLTIGVNAIQARLSIRNPNIDDVRVEAQIVFISNLNDQTDDAVDFLRPDVFMLYKKGGGNLLYDGLAKKGIRNKATGASSVRDYQIIARKVVTIKGTYFSGKTIEDQGNCIYIQGVNRRNITLTKYFKRERKHNCKYATGAVPRMLTDGNYYLIIFSDLALDDNGQRHIEYCGASSMKIRMAGATQPLSS